eukprot:scaffold63509_cov19-Prasinocladus_malaysianus.AAC.1
MKEPAKNQAFKRSFVCSLRFLMTSASQAEELEVAFNVLVVEGRALGKGSYAKARIRPREYKYCFEALILRESYLFCRLQASVANRNSACCRVYTIIPKKYVHVN